MENSVAGPYSSGFLSQGSDLFTTGNHEWYHFSHTHCPHTLNNVLYYVATDRGHRKVDDSVLGQKSRAHYD